MRQKNSSFAKMWREWRLLYVKANISFLSYFAHFFLELEIFRTKIVEGIKTLIYVQYFPPPKIVPIIKKMWKNIIEPDSPQVKT
jgi:hypothetical protein